MRSPYCLWVYPQSIFEHLKLGMYIMLPEPILTAYFINPSHRSVCLYLLCKNVPAATNTHNRRIAWRVVFYAVHVVWKESRRLVLPRTSCYPYTIATRTDCYSSVFISASSSRLLFILFYFPLYFIIYTHLSLFCHYLLHLRPLILIRV
jgi:hypothetical protein